MRHIYADFIGRVAKPVRYLGGEYNQVRKDPAQVDARVVLAFPDVYEIGMSHLGTKILYTRLNRDERIGCERCFCPWLDMEAELRERGLPLVALESGDPLSAFDVIGVSLQYELTYTNVLTMLDLGGVPLRAADRADRDPLVVGGGPCATHPEPVAAFFDALFIGEAEEVLPQLVVDWAAMRRAGRARRDALAELAARYPLYVPSLYREVVDADTGMVCVGEPIDPRAPTCVRRQVVDDLDAYPFPTDAPVPYAEAVFDRASVEIARGCTEGCRFCQAGMIYRPVRERDPRQIVDAIVGNVDRGGYDETSLTSLSTADHSCIAPLVREVAERLRAKKVSLSVSSLRAYGLSESVLDDLASVRATGLTFAPEAGTQRMRDVVNKNVTDEHIEQSAHRVFARGWDRIKLYFMIGLPTETDADVAGIVDTGARVLAIGRQYAGRRAEVTVSVSSHVPKPHTPFQWCAMDPLDEIERKQQVLRERAAGTGVRLRYHDSGISFLEVVFARGDRRLADAIELAWRRGARFDGWDECFDLDRWRAVFADLGVPVDAMLGTIPVTSRLPWDHIDVGLEDGFLLREYRQALKDRLSPPCGKPFGDIVHHTNVADAVADRRKLVCYDCGVACDLTKMRADRLDALRALGALEPRTPAATAAAAQAPARRRRPRPRARFAAGDRFSFRVRYAKLGRLAFLGHLDTMRVLTRTCRRAGIDVAYSQGFHPKPLVQFAPALSLGVPSAGELFDVALENDLSSEVLLERLREVAPDGLVFTGAARADGAPKLSKAIDEYELAVRPPDDGMRADRARAERLAAAAMARDAFECARGDKVVDVRRYLVAVDVVDGAVVAGMCALFDWPPADAVLRARVRVGAEGSAKPSEVAAALGIPGAPVARLGFRKVASDGARLDPLALAGDVATLGRDEAIVCAPA
ncbi:MAG: TIGR03960 family B12-binding radical SAM protein [Deltaproteobacteria bacterium]|nr:MAG: TIGR03960 family B12-binding radical SAM protein [Deltaproteobacteria bacterium]